MEHIKSIILEDPTVKIVLIIHFMGIPQEIDNLSGMLSKKGIYLIEDCAQALFARFKDGNSVGSKGDAAFFSLPKILPVPDGGLVIVNNPDIRLEKFASSRSVLHLLSIWFHLVNLLLKELEHRFRKRWCRRAINIFCKLLYGGYYLSMRHQISPSRMSSVTMRILTNIDYKEFIRKRSENARLIHSGLDQSKVRLLIPELKENFFLTGIPVLSEKRDRMIEQLRALEIDCLSYSRAWLCENANEYPFENIYCHQHLLLPVHEELTRDQIEYMIRSLNSLGNRR